jgi:hypothetical protein
MYLIEINNDENSRYSYEIVQTEDQKNAVIAGIELVHDVSGCISYDYSVRESDAFYQIAIYRQHDYSTFNAAKKDGAVYLTNVWIGSQDVQTYPRAIVDGIVTAFKCMDEAAVVCVCLVYPDETYYRPVY